MKMQMTLSLMCGEGRCRQSWTKTAVVERIEDVPMLMAGVVQEAESCGWVICRREDRAVCIGCWERSNEERAESEEEEEDSDYGSDRCNCDDCRAARGE